ncbi:LysR family transcriptional regulator [Streptomyces capillispiralis]|uniref:DNA-binding transcriptional LysR family regulator n=1 Tax=Streptomyces capillispiralis TaxID=68182 RepID=A0A561TN77_9ACTN|nr:LysR family transcriptional regulator [Streptomyces capillispiralis]TWF88561.1 DNA-binding transcriptional LysR family regulator [Streptomyces capillispiralis]GHH92262.1 LysR family transcriptional regulator [Streptomyces capillispiralis]
MEIRQLRHFVAVVTEGSFTAAARAELIVRSALSTSVRNLERELGADLFDRTGRRVVLTEAGRALLPQARALPAGARSARDAVAAVAGLHTGRVSIGTIQTLTCVDLPGELAAFHQEFPAVRVSVRDATVDELTEALRAGELDLAYLAPDARELPKGLTVHAVWHEELVLITAPGPARPRQEGADQGSRRGAVRGLPRGHRSGDGRTAPGRALRAAAPDHLRRHAGRLLVELVRAGIGVAFVPRPIGERAGLPCVTVRQPDPGRTMVPAGRGPRPRNPAAAALLGHLTRGRADLTDAGSSAG